MKNAPVLSADNEYLEPICTKMFPAYIKAFRNNDFGKLILTVSFSIIGANHVFINVNICKKPNV